MILVVGATGQLGHRVCRRLLESGESVRAMTRDPERAQTLFGLGVEVVEGDLRDRSTLSPVVLGCEAVIHCATGRPARGNRSDTARAVDDAGTASLVAAARDAGVGRIVYISAFGAAPDAPLEALRMKYRAEWHVLHSGMHFTILRPAAFAETWLEPLAGRIARGRRANVPGTARQLISFVSAEDVAALAVLALSDRDLEDRTVDVGGDAPITLEHAIRVMGQATGRTPLIRRVSPSLMRATGFFVGFVDPVLADRLDFGWCVATHGHVCESAGLQRTVPRWKPKTIEQLAEQFARPT